MSLQVLLISLRGNSGSDRYYELLNKALNSFSSLNSDLIFLPSFLEILPFLIPQYLRKLNLTHYSIIHTNSEFGHFFRTKNKILINTIHHNIFESQYREYTSIPQKIFHQFWIKPNLKKSLTTAHATIAVSNYTKQSTMKKFALGQNSIDLIYNGIDTNQFTKTNPLKKKSAKIRLLFVGNNIRRKGFDMLPVIMEKLGTEYELYFTTGLRNIKSFHRQHHLPQNMFPLPQLSTEELVNEYNKCDALLFPSRLEGFGYCIAEALSCGKPVITTNCSAMPELIKNGINGFLCNLDDINDFVNKIRAHRQINSKATFEDAQKRFDLRHYAREMENFYLNIIKSTGKT